jgi:hypothetical protein
MKNWDEWIKKSTGSYGRSTVLPPTTVNLGGVTYDNPSAETRERNLNSLYQDIGYVQAGPSGKIR